MLLWVQLLRMATSGWLIFETMTGGVVRRGIEGARSHGEEIEAWVLRLDEHMDRLATSAKALGLSDQFRTRALGEA